MAIHVRRAGLPELDALVPLFDAYRAFYGKPSDLALARSFLRERLARQQSIVFLAQAADGTTLGFTQLYPCFSSVSAGRTFILNDLFVAPAGRRQGVAKALLTTAADFGRSEGALRLSLSTAIDNAPAQALYHALGWVRDAEFCEFTLSLPV